MDFFFLFFYWIMVKFSSKQINKAKCVSVTSPKCSEDKTNPALLQTHTLEHKRANVFRYSFLKFSMRTGQDESLPGTDIHLLTKLER